MKLHPALQSHIDVMASLPGGRVIEIERWWGERYITTRPWMEEDVVLADDAMTIEINHCDQRVAAAMTKGESDS